MRNAAVIDPEILLNVFAQMLYYYFIATSCVSSVTAPLELVGESV